MMASLHANNEVSSTEGDSGDAAKIFVGGLDWDTTADELRNYFETYGTVLEASIKADHNTGRSRGFGFVQFADPSSVDSVVNTRSHVLGGKIIDPKRVKYKSTLESLTKIFVGGLSTEISEETVRSYFSQFGEIDEIDMPCDRTTNERRRFCFIRFTSNDPVARVLLQHRHKIAGVTVEVKRALNKAELAMLGPHCYPSPYPGTFVSPPMPSIHSRGRGSYNACNGGWSIPSSSFSAPSPGNGYAAHPYAAYGNGNSYYHRPSAPVTDSYHRMATDHRHIYPPRQTATVTTVNAYQRAPPASGNASSISGGCMDGLATNPHLQVASGALHSMTMYTGGFSGRGRVTPYSPDLLRGVAQSVRPPVTTGRGRTAVGSIRHQPYCLY